MPPTPTQYTSTRSRKFNGRIPFQLRGFAPRKSRSQDVLLDIARRGRQRQHSPRAGDFSNFAFHPFECAENDTSASPLRAPSCSTFNACSLARMSASSPTLLRGFSHHSSFLVRVLPTSGSCAGTPQAPNYIASPSSLALALPITQCTTSTPNIRDMLGPGSDVADSCAALSLFVTNQRREWTIVTTSIPNEVDIGDSLGQTFRSCVRVSVYANLLLDDTSTSPVPHASDLEAAKTSLFPIVTVG